MSVTIKDIAKILGVSHTTVSRALNDSPLIRQDTKERVKELAKTLNYTPNYNAKSLVLDKSYNIGLFFSTLHEGTSSSFFYEVVRGVNAIIHKEFNLVVRGIDDCGDLNAINKKHFDGIIVMSQSTKDDLFIYNALEKQIPLVVLNREIQDAQIVNILSDDRKGAYNAAAYLIKEGHKQIAVIEGKKGFKSSQERKEGFLQALIDHDIPIHKDFIVEGKYDMESGYRSMKKLLQLPVIPTAVFCSNDDMAVGAMRAVVEQGLKVPQDISIIGFDDNIFSSFLSPALTTVKRPIEEISKEGAKKLLDLIRNRETTHQLLYFHTELKIRQSVRKIND
ncbi:transcriptional regulator, LacI family [Geosporobacter subterraneus DSM 17957]|uniref:Transcriptional regulator, LacI family n=1 Tax=Geosporobacter subterraneus DSM 17957 TaxID=1121919 RepID=A0A1M6N695_9FIRM|nr:LacI family DNA-binding transcriptional regulator [Geosporobacter subterraneus]SHJ91214.1 transcriptional regulator, LacI family [Geosporobacter subterraneus DSM 17957]